MTTEPTVPNTPPMPEPPSMRGPDGRLVPDAIGFARMVAYVQDLQDYASAGWVKVLDLDAERDALKAKLEEAERVIQAMTETSAENSRVKIEDHNRIVELDSKLQGQTEAYARLATKMTRVATEKFETRAQAAALAEALEELHGTVFHQFFPGASMEPPELRISTLPNKSLRDALMKSLDSLTTYREGR